MENKKLIKKLYLCAAQCNQCYNAFLIEKDRDKLPHCVIILTTDCAEMCRITAQHLDDRPESADKLLELCAKICSDCASECDKHVNEHCKRCAALCRQCSEMCLQLQPLN